MINADFDSVLVPKNGNQNLEEFYTNKCQNHVDCSFGYKLMYVVDHFSKPFKSNLGQDAVHKFIAHMVK